MALRDGLQVSMEVQVTVLVKEEGRVRLSSKTLLVPDDMDKCMASRIVADTARLVGEEAMFGHLLPTPRREGGRG